MKKTTSTLLALSLALAIGVGVAGAETIPKQKVNPQQSGHVAYLESLYGQKKAAKIIDEYGRIPYFVAGTALPEYLEEAQVQTGAPTTIVQPSISGPDWASLRVGDYFTYNGQLYYVGRFATVAGSRMLVAYPATAYGIFDPSTPRYFYI